MLLLPGGNRDYENRYRHLAPIYSPVCWSTAGEVFILRPTRKRGGTEEPTYAWSTPRYSHLGTDQGLDTVRRFKSTSDINFVVQEDASPPQMYEMMGKAPGILKAKDLWSTRKWW